MARKKTRSKPVQKKPLRTVNELLKNGDITQDAANSAERWYRNYAFGYCDCIEFPPGHQSSSLTKHDRVSWQMARANAMREITTIRDSLGLSAHQRLRMMLVDELSFRAMGEALFPSISSSSSQRKIAAQCSLLLTQLAEYDERKRRALRPEAEKTRQRHEAPAA